MKTGGCLCGALRFEAPDQPRRTVVCHTLEEDPGELALLGGTFDDTSWITVDRHVWTRPAQHWFAIPAGTPAFEKSSRAASRPPR